jgi:hypothetical protein
VLELAEALVRAADELLDQLGVGLGIVERVAQGGGGVGHVVGAFGEVAGGVEEVQVRDLARTRLVQQPPGAAADFGGREFQVVAGLLGGLEPARRCACGCAPGWSGRRR